MSEFKAGDKVRRTSSPVMHQGMPVGAEDTVVEVTSSIAMTLENYGPGHSMENFELVKAAPRRFKIGDKVRRVSGNHLLMTPGDTDEVVDIKPSGALSLKRWGEWHDDRKFELVEDEPEVDEPTPPPAEDPYTEFMLKVDGTVDVSIAGKLSVVTKMIDAIDDAL